jgi:hypothetical protein
MMAADDPAVHDLVEVVRPYLGLATGRRDAEELAGVDAAHPGAHADHSVSVFAASVDDLFDDEAEVAEGLVDPIDRDLEPGPAGLLAGRQGMSSQSSVMTASSSSVLPLQASAKLPMRSVMDADMVAPGCS